MPSPFKVVSSVSFSTCLTTTELFLGVNDRTKDGMGCCSSYDLHVPMYWSVFFNAGLFIATGLVLLCTMADIFFMAMQALYIQSTKICQKETSHAIWAFPWQTTRKDPKKLKNMYYLLFFRRTAMPIFVNLVYTDTHFLGEKSKVTKPVTYCGVFPNSFVYGICHTFCSFI